MKKVGALVLLLTLPAALALAVATVVEADGLVEARVGGEWIALGAGDELPTDATIATGFRSRAVVRVGSSTITVEPLSQVSLASVSIEESNEQVNLDLPFGEIRAEVKRDVSRDALRGVEFRVLSPLSTAAVRGTVFTYDGVELDVAEGRVELLNAYGQWHSVAAGQQSRAYRWSIASVETTALEASRGE